LNTLADHTHPELMVPHVAGATAAEVIVELSSVLDRAGVLSDRALFVDAVMARERLSPTSFSGWAVPHARLRDLQRLSFAVGRCLQPLAWGGEGSVRIQIVWLFAVPERESKAYLNLIAAVARLSQDAARTEQLLAASDPQTMYSVLEKVDLRRPQSPSVVTDLAQSPAAH
jgi:mannitol/fructose-specific phosphotransferase system IIA component (Ntr-type)